MPGALHFVAVAILELQMAGHRQQNQNDQHEDKCVHLLSSL